MPRPRSTAIDRAVVDACVELLGEVGRARLTRERIARRAGVSVQAVTRRYASVEDVLVDFASTPWHDGPPAADSLRSYLVASLTRTVRTFAAGAVRRPAAELLAAAAGDERIDAAFAASLRRVRAEGVRRGERAVAAGELAPGTDPGLLLDLLTGAVYHRLLWQGEVMPEDEVERMVDLVLRGAAG